MKAIVTKYLGPTNANQGRVRAVAADGDRHPPSVTVHWDHGIGVFENHKLAAMALAAKMGWTGTWYGGSVAEGWAFVRQAPGEGFTVHG